MGQLFESRPTKGGLPDKTLPMILDRRPLIFNELHDSWFRGSMREIFVSGNSFRVLNLPWTKPRVALARNPGLGCCDPFGMKRNSTQETHRVNIRASPGLSANRQPCDHLRNTPSRRLLPWLRVVQSSCAQCWVR